MKKITFKGVVTFFALAGSLALNAQEKTKSETIKPNPIIELSDANKEAFAQTGYVRCLTDEHELSLQAKYPNRNTREQFEQWLAPHLSKINADRVSGKSQPISYTIPVVIHIIHNGDAVNSPGNIVGENISDAQALSQIQVLNEDYQRLFGSPGGANSTGLAEDLEISFCLAQQDEFGAPTPGILRYNITPYSNTQTPTVVDDWEIRSDVETMKATNQWDPTKYMNMWSIKPGGNSLTAPINPGLGGLLGYAQFPERSTTGLGDLQVSQTASTDGVVAGYDAFGDIGENDGSFILNGTYNLGRTMTHEVGHWLGLYHTFQGGCFGGDLCADTPAISGPNYTCVVSNSCAAAGNDMIQNYMDYTPDACMDTFTQNQKDRVTAVMNNSPRRVELNSSIGCQASAPFISFELETLIQNESTDCNFTDITVNVKIGKAPTQPANVTITKTGTATDTFDYEIIGGSLVFPSVGFANQSFTLRVYNDGFVEGDETLTLGMSLNANSGDAVLTTATDKEMVVTIIDNDLSRNDNVVITHFSDDFEDQDISDWTLSEDDGDGKTWGMYAIGGTPQTNPVAITSQSWDSTSGALNPDNWAVSPAIDLTSAIAPISLEWKVQAAAQSWDLEEYSIYVSTSNATGTLVGSTTTFNEVYDDPADAGTSYTRTLVLDPSLAGQIVYVGLRHWNCTDQEWLSIDDINVTSAIPTDIQLAVNSANQIPLSSAGSIYSSDDATGDVMVDITNNNGVDYSCVSTNVSRASGTAQVYQVPGAANFVMDKTFVITPGSVQAGGNATLKFYFTEVEIAAWELSTGNSRGSLVIIKDNGTSEYVSASIGVFGTHVTLEGSFTSGISGTYYFGRQEAILSVADNQFDLFSVYPNPSYDGKVSVKLSATDNVNVNLFDIIGRKVFTKFFKNNSSQFSETFDFSSLSSGVYMLDVNSGGKRAIKKIIIQ
jgi:hypothetical protein